MDGGTSDVAASVCSIDRLEKINVSMEIDGYVHEKDVLLLDTAWTTVLFCMLFSSLSSISSAAQHPNFQMRTL